LWNLSARLTESVHRKGRIVIRLDSSAAWALATRLVSANRDVLAAIAGVFFLLPTLAFAILVPEPQIPAGLPPREMMTLLGDAYGRAMPFLLLVSVLQITGTLTVLVVMTAHDRPTVAQAIRRGFVMTGPYLLAQLLIGLTLGGAFVLFVSLMSLTGIQALAAAAVLMIFAVMVYCGLRVMLIAPVIATENLRNPVAAIRRSWALTRGNTARIGVFLTLAGLVFFVIYGLIMMLVGVVLVLTTGGELQRALGAAVSSAITSGAMVYLTAMLAAMHHLLSGPTGPEIIATFE
jgi:hypothetical protein